MRGEVAFWQLEANDEDLDAEDDAAELVGDIVFEVPGFWIEGIEAERTDEDTDEESERRL